MSSYYVRRKGAQHKDTFSTCIYALIWTKIAHPCGVADTEECTQFAFSGYSPKWRYGDAERHRGDELLKKGRYFFFFAFRKYSRCFIKFRLNHWWQMDYPDDAFHTFLCLDSVNYFAVIGTVTSLMVFIQNILNCVPKTNKAFTDLERHGGKWLMTKCSFWGGVTL